MGIFNRRKLDLANTVDYLKKNGHKPVVDEETICWETDGKINSLRIACGCQLEIYREYPIPEEILGKFESAASRTMDEVFMAKIGVRRLPDGNGCIFFAAELFCSSVKELETILPASINILDTAETRQRENLNDIIAAETKPKRRIGFVQGYMEEASTNDDNQANCDPVI